MNLYRRLDAISMRDVDRWRARANLERAEYLMGLMARAARAVNAGFQTLIVRPLLWALKPRGSIRAAPRSQRLVVRRTLSSRSQ